LSADGAFFGHFVTLVDVTAYGADKFLAHWILEYFMVKKWINYENAKIRKKV
jgi:hypothetical protein